MAIPYQEYYDKAMSRYEPQRKAEMKASNADMGDRGLGYSTSAVGALGDIRSRYNALASAEANQQGAWQMGFDRDTGWGNQDRIARNQQDARNEAYRWWEGINSRELARSQLDDTYKARFANTPKWYKSYQTTGRLKYKGDGKDPGYEGHEVDLGNSRRRDYGEGVRRFDAGLASEQDRLAESVRQFDERLSAEREQAALDRAQAERGLLAEYGGDPSDPWTQISNSVFKNATTDIDPKTPGLQIGALPSKMLAGLTSLYPDIDIMREAQNGNERAIAVLKLLYPETWQQRLGMEPVAQKLMGGATTSPYQRATPLASNDAKYGGGVVDPLKRPWRGVGGEMKAALLDIFPFMNPYR
jgi:hypothetical protein